MINETKLTALIGKSIRNIVNVKDDYFEYCNGFMIAYVDYTKHKVISKLFNVGAIQNYKDWKPTLTQNLSKFANAEGEIKAIDTGFIKNKHGEFYCIFKVGDSYKAFNKKVIDVFTEVNWRAETQEGTTLLRAYNNDKFEGLILEARIDKEEKEIIEKLYQLEV